VVPAVAVLGKRRAERRRSTPVHTPTGRDTGGFQHLPPAVSISAGSHNLDWCEVSHTGTVSAVT